MRAIAGSDPRALLMPHKYRELPAESETVAAPVVWLSLKPTRSTDLPALVQMTMVERNRPLNDRPLSARSRHFRVTGIGLPI